MSFALDVAEWETFGSALVADGLDALGSPAQVVHPDVRFLPFAGARQFFLGPCRTMQVRALAVDKVAPPPTPEQLSAVLKRVDGLAEGGAVVAIGFAGEVLEAGVVGELILTTLAAQGVVGLITDGYVRDLNRLAGIGLPVLARGSCARNALGRMAFVEFGGRVSIGGVSLDAGDLVCADLDGAVVIPRAVLDDGRLLAWLREAAASEARTVPALASGEALSDVFARFGRL